MAPEPILLFDGDNAGKRAAARAIDIALPHIGSERTLRFAFMSGGKDPDELLRNAGPDAVKAVVERTAALADMLFARELERQPLDTPERRVDLQRRLLEAVAAIKDEALRSAYRDEMMARPHARPAPAGGGRHAETGARAEHARHRGPYPRKGELRTEPRQPATQELLHPPCSGRPPPIRRVKQRSSWRRSTIRNFSKVISRALPRSPSGIRIRFVCRRR